MLINYHFLDQGKPFSYHTKSRSAFIKIYADHLGAETTIGGHVMDIGCGHGINPTISLIIDKLGHVDGVDPFPAIKPHALIRNRWECKLEELPVAPGTYDMAYSFNVVEHVDNVDSYLSKVVEILRPNAVYWSMSPNARHPYALCVRLLQALRLKGIYRALLAPQANDYPAYYRLCSDRLILDAIRRSRLNVAQIDFYYVHCVQWDTFLPRSLRFVANWVDKGYVLRSPKASNIFMFRLQRGV